MNNKYYEEGGISYEMEKSIATVSTYLNSLGAISSILAALR